MTLQKAIEIKEEMHALGLAPYDEASLAADQMSIEAMKRVFDQRDPDVGLGEPLLPGETEE